MSPGAGHLYHLRCFAQAVCLNNAAGEAFASIKRNMLHGVTQRFLLRRDVCSPLFLVEWVSRTLQADSAVFVKHKPKKYLDSIAFVM